MNTDENNQELGDQVNGAGDGTTVVTDEVKLTKAEYEELVKTKSDLGSLKREYKDLKKSLEAKETPTKNQAPADNGLLQKSFLRAAGISDPQEIELALSTAKKWGMEVDAVVDDEDFKVKLERLRTQKSNEIATSNIRGGQGTNQAKNTPEYWLAKGTPPTASDVPDRKARTTIARAFMKNASSSGKKFYND